MNFDLLTNTIVETHTSLQQSAVKAINIHLTVRNWLIGFYIVEFEQKGEHRAKYGEGLIDALEKKLKHIKGIDRRSLFRFRTFYLYYPHIANFLKESNLFKTLPPSISNLSIVGSATPLLKEIPMVPAEKIIAKLSYTHIEQLLAIENPLKRTFYEVQAIKGTWSVSELKRQIASLYFERSGMSVSPEKLSEITNQKYASQLNTYVAYFNAEVKREDDNPTIGILLCTQKGKKLVDYALAGMDENLFVSKYLVELPTEAQFVAFINNDLKNI